MLAEDRIYHTSKTFLTDAQYLKLLSISSRQRRIEFIICVIKENHKELSQTYYELLDDGRKKKL